MTPTVLNKEFISETNSSTSWPSLCLICFIFFQASSTFPFIYLFLNFFSNSSHVFTPSSTLSHQIPAFLTRLDDATMIAMLYSILDTSLTCFKDLSHASPFLISSPSNYDMGAMYFKRAEFSIFSFLLFYVVCCLGVFSVFPGIWLIFFEW